LFIAELDFFPFYSFEKSKRAIFGSLLFEKRTIEQSLSMKKNEKTIFFPLLF